MRFVLWGAMLSSALVGSTVTATSPQAAGLDGLHGKIQVGNRLCMAGHSHHGSGSGTTRERALADATKGWGSFTALEYGQEWGDFRTAHNQTVSCSPSVGGWSCNLTASPCRAAGPVARHVATQPQSHRVAHTSRAPQTAGVAVVPRAQAVPAGGSGWPGDAR